MTDTAERIAQIPLEKRELLLRRLSQQGVARPGLPAIQPVSRDGNTFPLSFSQERLWLLDQLEPNNYAYNIPGAIRLAGPLNLPAMKQALNTILARHESLRTNFTTAGGQPVQIIGPVQPLPLEIIDLGHLPAETRTAEAERLAQAESRQPFDLTRDLLVRAKLIKLGPEEHVFLLTMHHIVSDGWSMGIVAREFAELYQAFGANQPNPLPPLSLQYVDFASWQRQWLQGEQVTEQIAYWKQQLSGELPTLDLLLDRPRPPVQSLNSSHEVLHLAGPLTQALKQFSQAENTTLFMTLLAAFKLLLQRSTGLDDIIVGSPVAGRNRTEIENLIGFFINTLVLRTDLSGDLTFRELLHRVRRITLDAYAHQDVPFEKLLIELQPERSLSRTPLFQVFFNMLTLDHSQTELAGLTTEDFAMPEAGSKFDMTLYLSEEKSAIKLLLVYNSDLFYPERMVEFLAQYSNLLTQIAANPNEKIARYQLLTPASAARLPDPVQPLDITWSGAVTTHFAENARKFPDRLALVDELGSWTYQSLETRSNQLAHYLQAHQVGASDVVAIYGHRSAALVQAILGVLKAGAAFMILDPAYPPARLLDYVRLAQPCAWLQLSAAGPLPPTLDEWLASAPLNCRLQLEPGEPGLLADYPARPPDLTIDPDQLAYLAFTSGSTGQPKAIMGTHRPLSHFFAWSTQTFAFQPTDRFAMLSGLAHDPLLRDIFTPLWTGASLFIPDPQFWYAPDQLAAWLRDHRLSVVHLTPALATTLAAESGICLPDLRFAFFGGDLLTSQHLSDFRRLAPAATLVNFYGATETPQAIAFYPINLSAPLPSRIPLGQGIPGAQLLVLNQDRQLAGVGELGEIYIRSPYLAAGYFADEDLTRERFIPNPFTRSAADRLYKSGDLGRFLPSGHVEFLGRNDDQVKIRGFRIEPGDIETTLNQHPAVHQTVVVVREDSPGDKRLVAYVVPKTTQPEPEISELRRFVQALLPEYMIPSLFVVLEELPLTPNNKIDRKALPVPSSLRPELENAFVASQTPTEEVLAHIWVEVLGLEQVGVHDNFFHLGGHSLLATRVISRVREEFQLDLPLRHFFMTPTIAQIAELIDTVLWMNKDRPAIPDAAMEEREELEL